MNSRMTLRQLCAAASVDTTVYIASDEEPDELFELSYYLRGCSGVMSIEVMRFYPIGENGADADIVAVLDIPARWLAKEDSDV